MKERLTRYNNIEMSGKKGSASLKVPLQEAINRLAEYEDLEEQGLIVRLPCKVGTPIFLISNQDLISGKRCLYESVVKGFVTDGYSTYYNLGLLTENINSSNIFSTREEAEKKLGELNK